jgi:hypothetical protein
MSILSKEDLSIKRQAMAVVGKNDSLRKKAAIALLSVPNRFGTKNKLVNENIDMIGEFRLVEAKPGLENISKVKAFWKKSLKRSATKALSRLI